MCKHSLCGVGFLSYQTSIAQRDCPPKIPYNFDVTIVVELSAEAAEIQSIT